MEEKAKMVEEKAKKAAAARRQRKRKPARESSTATCPKKNQVLKTSDGDIDPNIICCTCFAHSGLFIIDSTKCICMTVITGVEIENWFVSCLPAQASARIKSGVSERDKS